MTANPEANGYRLPTEEEWEFAAQGGLKSRKTKYSGSDSVEVVADYFGNNNIATIPIGSKKPNELGLHNMSGSLWEYIRTSSLFLSINK